MLRNILSVFVGVLFGALVVFVIEMAGHVLFPPPTDIDLKDPAQLRAAMAQIPVGAKLLVVAGWFLGAFAGCALTSVLSRRWAPAVWVVAATMTLFVASTLMAIPHPWWMMIAGLLASPIAGYLAVKATGARYGAPPDGRPRDPIAGL